MRERFLVLDSLRGLAALSVLIFHLHSISWFSRVHAYLSVDFFFLLSGFVLAHAYEARMREPGAIAGFLRERVIRLHPLLILSILPAAILLLLNPIGRDPLPALTAIAAAIPFPAIWKLGLPFLIFPLNLPSWSLFWELVVNIIFAVLAPRLGTRTLVAIVTVTGAALAVATFNGVSDGRMAIAGLRALALFPLGVLLLRMHRANRWRLGRFGSFAVPLFLAVILVPGPFDQVRDLLARFVIFPAILLAAAGHGARFPAIYAFLGGMSYPLYVLHMPVTILLGMGFVAAGYPVSDLLNAALSLPIIWLIWRFYDEPVRAWLRRRVGWRRPREPIG